MAKDAANKYEERDTRGVRLNDYSVSSDPREAGAIINESKKTDVDDY